MICTKSHKEGQMSRKFTVSYYPPEGNLIPIDYDDKIIELIGDGITRQSNGDIDIDCSAGKDKDETVITGRYSTWYSNKSYDYGRYSDTPPDYDNSCGLEDINEKELSSFIEKGLKSSGYPIPEDGICVISYSEADYEPY